MQKFKSLNKPERDVYVAPTQVSYIEGVYSADGVARGVRLVMSNGHTHEVAGEFHQIAEAIQFGRDFAVGLV